MAVIDDVKRHNPRTVTVMGGPHVTFSAPQTLNACPSLDVAVLGEGERTMVELVRAAAAGSGFENVAGIAHRADAAIRFTPPRGFIADLDSLPPPARRLLPLGRYRALGMPISMTTTRGCPHQCIFCIGRKMVGAKAYRSSRKVAVTRGHRPPRLPPGQHRRRPVHRDKGHCAAVCDEILRRGLTVQWTSFARVDTVSEDILSKMKAAGCTAVFRRRIGNSGILSPRHHPGAGRRGGGHVRGCGRHTFASFILGLRRNAGYLRETIAFGKRFGRKGSMYGFHILLPFPGTVRERGGELASASSRTAGLYHANRAVAEANRHPPDARRDRRRLGGPVQPYLGDIKKPHGKADADESPATNLERIV
jgi:hypothetical protein